jgi:rSAM/selenodomain-associated transferase 1
MKTAILFLKAPVAGRVKTRLAKDLGSAEACALYRELAQDVYKVLKSIDGIRIEVAYDPHPDHPDVSWLDPKQDFFIQKGQDLGHRLIHAFETAFHRGATKVVVLGSDSPGLHADWIAHSFEALETCGVSLGPAEDGGYYLIGLGAPHPELFTNIPWSTPKTLEETLHRAQEAGLRVHILPRHFDVDDAEGVKRWKRNGNGNGHHE